MLKIDEYTSRILHPLARVLEGGPTDELVPYALSTLCALVYQVRSLSLPLIFSYNLFSPLIHRLVFSCHQLGSDYLVFHHIVKNVTTRQKIHHKEYDRYQSNLYISMRCIAHTFSSNFSSNFSSDNTVSLIAHVVGGEPMIAPIDVDSEDASSRR